MSFDSTCRRLAEQFPEDFASWLLGRRINSVILDPTELSLEAIRADIRQWVRQTVAAAAQWTPWRFELSFGLSGREKADPGWYLHGLFA